jgi:hypothetical protein
MLIAEQEKTRLLEDRVGIKAHMKSLLKSLDDFDVTSTLLKDRVWCYRQRLYDVREAIQFHLQMDDIVFSRIPRCREVSRTVKQREKLLGLVTRAIQLTDTVVESDRSPGELARIAKNIREISGMIYQVIDIHAALEDKLLGQASPKT